MSEAIKDINIFFTGVSEKINHNGKATDLQLHIHDDLLGNNECFYVFDLRRGEIIEQKGLEKVLGVSSTVTRYNELVARYHPDDTDTVLRISQATINHCLNAPFECKDSLLQLTYRFKKDENTYIRILSQSSVYKMNRNGIIQLILVKLTDISFLESTEYVNWTFKSKNLDKDTFKKTIFKAYSNFFTERELEIIKEIAKDHSTKEIADQLNISEQTVATHRKNILKKAHRHNTKDLIVFCKRKGIL